MSCRSSGVRSSLTFLAFCFGRMTSRMPTRRAASTFSLTPPIGSTRPDSVISPVIAMSPRTGRPVSCDAIAVAIVTPADGPSFGNRARRHVHVHLGVLEEVRIDAVLLRVRAEPRQRGARRLLHDVAELAGQGQRAGAGHPRRFDEQHFAAGRRPRQADRDARILGALLHLLVEELRRAEHLDDDVRRDLDRRLVAFRAPPRDLAAERADLALEVADAGLARVAANHLAQRIRR